MTDYQDMTIRELDEILDELGLDKTGLKADKVSRLEAVEIPLEETPMAGRVEPEVTTEDEREVIQSLAVPVKQPDRLPIQERMWSGIKPVYACPYCDRQEDDKDDMIFHYVMHFPEEERESIFNDLVKDN